jgi:hypothetical protein
MPPIVHSLLLLALMAGSLFSMETALAQDPPNFGTGFDTVENIGEASGVGDTDPYTTIVSILRILLALMAIVALAVIVIGGILYIISFGDEKRAERAKTMILYAIIGLIIVGLSALIVNFTLGLFFAGGGGGGNVEVEAQGRFRPSNLRSNPLF